MILADWIVPGISGRLCLVLLHSLWITPLLFAIAWITGRRSIQRGYLTHSLALILALAALPLTYVLVSPPANAPQQAATSPTLPRTQPDVLKTKAMPLATDGDQPNSAMIPVPVADEGHEIASAPDKQIATTIERTPAHHAVTPAVSDWSLIWIRYTPWIAWAYLIGVLVMLTRLGRGLYGAARLANCGVPIDDKRLTQLVDRLRSQWSLRVRPALRHAEHIIVPKVVGLVKPTILVPTAALTGLPLAELEMIIAHELAHVRRYDMLVNLVQRLAESVLFFNPALWYLSRRISTLREYCCDELACEATAPQTSAVASERRLLYAQALLHAVELQQKVKHCPAIASLAASGRSPSELRRRVARLFGEPIREPVRITRSGIFAAVAIVLLLLARPIVWSSEAGSAAQEVDSATHEEPKPDVVLDGEFSSQAAGILADVFRESKLPYLTEPRVAEYSSKFGETIRQAIESIPINLDDVSDERQIAILTNLRDNSARPLHIEGDHWRYASLNAHYFDLPDYIKTLEWKLFMALTRGELDADEKARREELRQWVRNKIRSLEEKLNCQNAHYLDGESVTARELNRFDNFFNDPLLPQFDRPMSDKQLARFKQEFNNRHRDSMAYVSRSTVYPAFKSCWPRMEGGGATNIPLFDNDKISRFGWGFSGCDSGLGVEFKFQSNLRRTGGAGLSDFYRGVDFSAIDIRGFSTETLWSLRCKRDPEMILRSLEEREIGDIILDGRSSELVGIRGAKLVRLEADTWPDADAISNQELRTLLETQGTERFDLSETCKAYEEYERQRNLPQAPREPGFKGVFVGVLSAEGEMAVLHYSSFSSSRKNPSGKMRFRFASAHRIIRGVGVSEYRIGKSTIQQVYSNVGLRAAQAVDAGRDPYHNFTESKIRSLPGKRSQISDHGQEFTFQKNAGVFYWNNKLISITVNRPTFKTVEGIGPGSSVEEMREHFPEARLEEVKDASPPYEIWQAPGIAFLPDSDGKIVKVKVTAIADESEIAVQAGNKTPE